MRAVRLETLDLNLLRTFDALMRERSVTAAARRLNLTQPSVSNALGRLRRAADDRLLERVGNAMVPTRYAEDLWPSVREALHVLERGLARLERFDPATHAQPFRIGMDAYCVSFIAPGLARRLFREAPRAPVELIASPPHRDDEALVRGGCDIIIGPTFKLTPGVSRQVLFHEVQVVVTSEDHRFARDPESFDVRAYADARHALYAERGIVRGGIDEALRARGLERRIALSVPFYPALPELLASTDCIVTLGRALAEALCETPGLAILEPPIALPGFDVSMLWATRDTSSPSHRWLRDVCETTALASERRSTSAAVSGSGTGRGRG